MISDFTVLFGGFLIMAQPNCLLLVEGETQRLNRPLNSGYFRPQVALLLVWLLSVPSGPWHRAAVLVKNRVHWLLDGR